MRRRLAFLLPMIVPAAAAAQLLPRVPVPVLPSPGQLIGTVDGATGLARDAVRLAQARVARITALVRDNPSRIALDDRGDPARAGEVVIADPDDALIATATAQGFTVIERATIEGTDIGFVRLGAPPRRSLPAAIRLARKFAGGRAVSADQLHFGAGAVAPGGTAPAKPDDDPAPGARIGIIDGGVAAVGTSAIVQQGFARGAPMPSDHGSAVASLLVGTPRIRGSAAGARLWSADVYGNDPAGGSALAIARALGWLTTQQVPVVVISLVGPTNPLLARVVDTVQRRGVIIVAAVGNDGPAAPPAYPASYPGVVAVTGVDGRGRALIEAGRALHLDYAAPGADLLAANRAGGAGAVRGTSFAAPLVAARIARQLAARPGQARAAILAAIDAEAVDLGRKGADRLYGRGLVCGRCATPAK